MGAAKNPLPFPGAQAVPPQFVPEKVDDPIEIGRPQWLAVMRQDWRQGQHVAIMGRTGRGKTVLARDLLSLRGWAVALAVKRADDTLDTFPQAGYKRISRWPPNYEDHRVLFWARPKNLDDIAPQAKAVRAVINDVYRNGGWAILLDDVAYIANQLGMRKSLGFMLNQARSSYASIISAMTQPSSVTQSIPSEIWRQVRYHLVFYYRVGRDLDAISDIVGYQRSTLKKWMAMLGPYDFLCFDDLTDQVWVVRNQGGF